MTTSAPSPKANSPWIDANSPANLKAIELGLDSVNISSSSGVVDDLRPPALLLSSLSTAGDDEYNFLGGGGHLMQRNSKCTNNLKQQHRPGTPLSHSHQSVLSKLAQEPNVGKPHGRKLGESFPSPIGRGTYRHHDNSSSSDGSDRLLSSSLDRSGIFLRTGENRSQSGISLGQSLAVIVGEGGNGKNTDKGSHQCANNRDRDMHINSSSKESNIRCSLDLNNNNSGRDSDNALLEGIGGCFPTAASDRRDLSSRPDLDANAGHSSSTNLGITNMNDSSTIRGLLYKGSFDEDCTTGYLKGSPGRSSLRSRAFSSPGPIELSRMGRSAGSGPNNQIGPLSPSTSSFSSMWDEPRRHAKNKGGLNNDHSSGMNLHLRSITTGQIPELSSTEDENVSSAGIFEGLQSGASFVSDEVDQFKRHSGGTGNNIQQRQQQQDSSSSPAYQSFPPNSSSGNANKNNDNNNSNSNLWPGQHSGCIVQDEINYSQGSDSNISNHSCIPNGDFQQQQQHNNTSYENNNNFPNSTKGNISHARFGSGPSGAMNYTSYEQNLSGIMVNQQQGSSCEGYGGSTITVPVGTNEDPNPRNGANGDSTISMNSHPQIRLTMTDVSENTNMPTNSAKGSGTNNFSNDNMSNFGLSIVDQMQHQWNMMCASGRTLPFTEENFNEQQFLCYTQQQTNQSGGHTQNYHANIPNRIEYEFNENQGRGGTMFDSSNNAGVGHVSNFQGLQHQPNHSGTETHPNMHQFHFQQQQQQQMQMQGPIHNNHYQVHQQQQFYSQQAHHMQSLRQQLYCHPNMVYENGNISQQQIEDHHRLQLQQRSMTTFLHEQGGPQQHQHDHLFIQSHSGESSIPQGPSARVFIPGMGTLIMSTSTGPAGESYGHHPRSVSACAAGIDSSAVQNSISSSSTSSCQQQHGMSNRNGLNNHDSQGNLQQGDVYQRHQGIQTIHPHLEVTGAILSSEAMIISKDLCSMTGRVTPPRSSGGHQSHVQQKSIVTSPAVPHRNNGGMHNKRTDAKMGTKGQNSNASSVNHASSSVMTASTAQTPEMRKKRICDLTCNHIEDSSHNVSTCSAGIMHQQQHSVGGVNQQPSLMHSRPTVANSSHSNSSSPMEQIGGMLPHFGGADSCSAGISITGSSSPRLVYHVKFKRTQRSFILGPRAPREVKIGCYVKVEADRGEDLGIVVSRLPADKFNISGRSSFRSNNSGSEHGGGSAVDLKRIIRLATHDEINLLVDKRQEEDNLLKICRSKVRQRGLTMHVVDAEYQFDRHKLIFFFEADGRIDFRELVRDLFSIYKTRIWMQQLDKGGCCPGTPSSGGNNSCCGSSFDAADNSSIEGEREKT
eukprot:CAMPEP_0195523562 /NCGR_PEP_ID=MMETSP0794_2-20130614/22821_1 /TAXON_ID=515487 /ORGANISM="Stephanopyxis turris, Strain CCMP 815" /LENGTH=1337 /DNA_ID=CAMNT_0040653585 /DNA_START=83 /DNA_END=4096 /DNA_ORIENTATION=+